MRREKLEHPVRTAMIEGKSREGKQCEKMLDGLTRWLKVRRVTELGALKVTRDRDAWKVMIESAKEQACD